MNDIDDPADSWQDAADDYGEEQDIQSLLEAGYGQLDGFVNWLESHVGLDSRTAQQDCCNAESLVDYLANQHRKSVPDVNEYELRWFVFSHYLRKSSADRETQERLTDSLQRFVQYLHEHSGMALPDWVAATLEDTIFYQQRLRALQVLAGEDEAEWKVGFRAWCEELENDLDLRCLWLPSDMGEGMSWGDAMGWREATLRDDANRRWQDERSELIADGLSLDAARDRLVTSYLIWLDTPQSRLDGATPRDTMRTERSEQRLNVEYDDGIADDM